MQASSGSAVSLIGMGDAAGGRSRGGLARRHEPGERLAQQVVAAVVRRAVPRCRTPTSRSRRGRDSAPRASSQPNPSRSGTPGAHVGDQDVGPARSGRAAPPGPRAPVRSRQTARLLRFACMWWRLRPGWPGMRSWSRHSSPAGPLDLHDLGAQVAQVHGGERARQVVREVQDAEAREREAGPRPDAILAGFCEMRQRSGHGPDGAVHDDRQGQGQQGARPRRGPARDARLLLREAARAAAEGAPRRRGRRDQQEAPRAAGGQAGAERREARRPGPRRPSSAGREDLARVALERKKGVQLQLAEPGRAAGPAPDRAGQAGASPSSG